MSAKSNRNLSYKVLHNRSMKSKTHSKQVRSPQNSSYIQHPVCTKSNIRVCKDFSEPFRMTVKLEDILKSCKKPCIKHDLKPQLIEPDFGSSIQSIECSAKSIQPALTIAKPVSPAESKKFLNIDSKSSDLNGFSLEKMQEDCKAIEENLIVHEHKKALREIENELCSKLKYKVKLTPQKPGAGMPNFVVVKSGESFKMFAVSN